MALTVSKQEKHTKWIYIESAIKRTMGDIIVGLYQQFWNKECNYLKYFSHKNRAETYDSERNEERGNI